MSKTRPTTKKTHAAIKKKPLDEKSAASFKSWREKLAITQEKAAHELGVTLRTVQHWEKGTIATPESVLKLMTAIAKGGSQEPWGGQR
jgi:DNA-binding transcriptional regulator YiaG